VYGDFRKYFLRVEEMSSCGLKQGGRRRAARGTRRTRRRSRRSGKSLGLFSRLYSPISHAMMFGRNTTNKVANTAKGVARLGINGVDGVGKSFSGHLNATVRNVFSRRNKNRRQSRRQRR